MTFMRQKKIRETSCVNIKNVLMYTKLVFKFLTFQDVPFPQWVHIVLRIKMDFRPQTLLLSLSQGAKKKI